MSEEARLQKRARVAYESGRLRGALVPAVVVALVVAGGVVGNPRPGFSAAAAVLAVALAATFTWLGGAMERAVVPGVLAGVVPMLGALVARNWAHWCTDEGCVELCVPVCVAGGLLAGYAVGRWARQAAMPSTGWAAAAMLTLAVGAVGCACAGYSGVAGLAFGVLVSTLPSLVLARTATTG